MHPAHRTRNEDLRASGVNAGRCESVPRFASAVRHQARWIACLDHCDGKRSWARRSLRRGPRAVLALCVFAVALVLQAPSCTAYLIKSFMHWERVGAFPQFIMQRSRGATWPRSRHCWNGPCGKNTPDYLCNPDCGNPNIGMTDDSKYPKAFLIRIVSAHQLSCRGVQRGGGQ